MCGSLNTPWEIDGETVETVSDFILSLTNMSWLTIESDFHWKLALFWMRDCERCCIMPILQMRNPRQGDFIICARVYKECSNYRRTALISHTSKVMLKILQARLQQYVNRELPDVQACFRKGKRNQRSNCQHPLEH